MQTAAAHQIFADNPVRDPFWKYPKCPLSGSPVQLGRESWACFGWFLELKNPLIDIWDMMSPTLDGGFIVCGQGRSERGCNQGAEVVKFERLLRQTGSGNQKLISLQIFLRVCMTPPPLAQGLLTYGTAISWAHHVYFQNNLLAPPLLCNSKTDMSLVGQL